MARPGNVKVSIVADARSLQKATKDSETAIGRLHKSATSSFKGIALAAGALGAALGALGLARKVGEAVKAFEESYKVAKQTEAVLKSTGNAANLTAKQIGDLANAISKKTGIDDEAIQSGENLLLTFKNIRNEAGKGNDIFDQTTKIMVDMSVALGTEAKGSAVQLGKALNDPIKGVAALSRVGVTFTAQQKEQIKTLVESGKTLEAQKIVLRELRSEFGGSAEAAATPFDKLKVAMGNLQERVGQSFAPTMELGAEKLLKLVDGMNEGRGAGGKLIGELDRLNAAARGVYRAFDNDLPIAERFQKARASIRHHLGPLVKDVENTFAKLHVGDKISEAIQKGVPLIADALIKAIPEAFDTAMGAIGNSSIGGGGLIAAYLFNKFGGPGYVKGFGGRYRNGGGGGGSPGGGGRFSGAGSAFSTAATAAALSGIPVATGDPLAIGGMREIDPVTGRPISGFRTAMRTPGIRNKFRGVGAGLGAGALALLPSPFALAALGIGGTVAYGTYNKVERSKKATGAAEKFTNAIGGADPQQIGVLSHAMDILTAKTSATRKEWSAFLIKNAEALKAAGLGADASTKDIEKVAEAYKKVKPSIEVFTNNLKQFKNTFPKLKLGDIIDPNAAAQFLANANKMQKEGVGSIKELRRGIRFNLDQINSGFEQGSDSWVVAVTRNGNAAMAALDKAMSRGKVSAKDGLSEIKRITKTNMEAVRDSVDVNSAKGQEALSAHFEAAVGVIRRQMARGKIAADKGSAAIASIMRDHLVNDFGYTTKQANNYIAGRNPTTAGPDEGSSTSAIKKAGGGWIGLPGQVGPDSVPIMAAPGEAVVNRHQMPFIERAMAFANAMGVSPFGSMGEMFSQVTKPHYMAKGGIVALGKRIQRMGYSVSENPAFGGVHGVHVKGSRHYSGQALDINADGRAPSEAVWLDKLAAILRGEGWNVLWRVPGHYDHLHVDTGSGVGGMGGFGAAVKLKRILVGKGLGVPGRMAQGAVDAIRRGAQARLDSIGGMGGDIRGNGGGHYSKGDLMGLASNFGWNARLMAAIALAESGGDPRAVNHNSNGTIDRGLWQVNSVHGFPASVLFDPVGNVKAAYKVFKQQGYKAWTTFRTGAYRKYMARGGFIGAARGLLVKSIIPQAVTIGGRPITASINAPVKHAPPRIKPMTASQAAAALEGTNAAITHLERGTARKEYGTSQAGHNEHLADLGKLKSLQQKRLNELKALKAAWTRKVNGLRRKLRSLASQRNSILRKIHAKDTEIASLRGRKGAAKRLAKVKRERAALVSQLGNINRSISTVQSEIANAKSEAKRAGVDITDAKEDLADTKADIAKVGKEDVTVDLFTPDEQAAFDAADRDLAIAEGTADSADDIAALNREKALLERALPRLIANPLASAEEIRNARSMLDSVNERLNNFSGNGTADVSARNEQLAARLAVAERTAALSEATLSVFRGPGDIGSGAANAYRAAQGPTIIINTLHPGDPNTLAAVGRAATAGMSLQGSVGSPRVATGL